MLNVSVYSNNPSIGDDFTSKTSTDGEQCLTRICEPKENTPLLKYNE
jgi:hypothetical protein